MAWKVEITQKARKQAAKLPEGVSERFHLLIYELKEYGAILPHRPHFGKLKGAKNSYHCHISGGHPTYVVCWRLKEDYRGVLCWLS
jgi:mRNA-degrading endonuclease RelE of RelBE toxin-antitoxin system